MNSLYLRKLEAAKSVIALVALIIGIASFHWDSLFWLFGSACIAVCLIELAIWAEKRRIRLRDRVLEELTAVARLAAYCAMGDRPLTDAVRRQDIISYLFDGSNMLEEFFLTLQVLAFESCDVKPSGEESDIPKLRPEIPTKAEIHVPYCEARVEQEALSW